MGRSIETLSVREVLALAIHVERANAERFRAFADVFAGYADDVGAKFKELAEEEDEHEEMLLEKYRQRFGDGEIPIIQEVEVEGVIEAVDLDDGEHMMFDSLPPEKVYQLALAAERGAQEYYRTAAKGVEDKELVALYVELAEMEDEHAGWLEGQIAATKQDEKK